MDEYRQGKEKWVTGAVIPIVMLIVGINGLITQSFTFSSRGGGHFTVHGIGATSTSIATIAFALLLHIYFFWKDRDGFEGAHAVLTMLSLAFFVGSFGYCAYVLLALQ